MSSDREKDIALVYKDIQYIKQDVTEMKASLKLVLEHYITRQEVEDRINRVETEINERMKGANARIDTKADQKDLDKIVTLLSRINLFIIMAILGALLGLIII